MAQGLQIFDAGGNLVFDTTDRISQILGSLTLGNGHAAGSFGVSGFSVGTGWCAVLAESQFSSGSQPRVPTRVTISGTTINYTAGDSCVLLYGVY
jgi:hypothetical protein